MKKVLVITYYWPPAGGAGVQRWLKMATYLPDFGIEPIVLTVDPNSASYPIRDEGFVREVPENLRVIRTPSFEPLRIYEKFAGKGKVPYSGFANVDLSKPSSKLSRWIRGNFFIPDARRGWNRFAYPKALELVENGEVDVVITTGPPHSTHLIGKKLKERTGVNWVADFRDPWTDIYYYDQLSHTPAARRIDARLEQEVLLKADLVLAVCPSNQALFAEKLPVEKRSKVVMVTNGYDPKDFQGKESTSISREFTLAYTGTIAPNYEIDSLIEALKKIDFPWRWVLAGRVAPEVKRKFELAGIEKHLDYLGHISHQEVIDLLVSSDILVHLLPKGFKATSGKLFEYIGSGTPILNIGHRNGDSAKFIELSRSGKTFDIEESGLIIQFLKEHQYSHNTSAKREMFSRVKITEALSTNLKSIAK